MSKINFNRVILGGLLTGVVFIIMEIVVEGLVSQFGINEGDLLLQASSNVTISGARYHIVNLSYFFVFCIFAIWLYAAIRPRFGAGPKTALIASFTLWFVGLLLAVNFVNMGIFPIKLTLISLAFNLIELPTAILVGASIYKEESSAT